MDVVRHQVGTSLQREERFFVSAQLAERFAQHEAGSAVAVDQGPAPLQGSQGVFHHAELDIALGFFNGPVQQYAVEGHALAFSIEE